MSKYNSEKYKAYYSENIEARRKASREYAKRTRSRDREKNLARVAKWRQDNYEYTILRDAKKRAAKKGLEFSIELSDIIVPEKCPLLGIVLFPKDHRSQGKKNSGAGPNSPSLDRIDPSKGYVKGNVWVISWRANKIKSDATLEELEKIVAVLRGLDRSEAVISLAVGDGDWKQSPVQARGKLDCE